jgi:nucleotide-binding universal stress UspA family protein
MKLFERVLVAVGTGEAGLDLMRYARGLAGVLDGALFTFVHVLGWSKEPVTHADALHRLQQDAAEHFGDATAPCMVIHGVVVDRLLETAAETAADLILLGHARELSGRRSLARRLAMQSQCSVWMKPFKAPANFRRVLAGVDYSEPSAYALSVAGHLAKRIGSNECRALHVSLNESGGPEPIDLDRERAAFDRFAAPLDTAGVRVTPVLIEAAAVADAVSQIAEAEPVDLVVMGSRGQSRSITILLGSESEHVLMDSRTPVLITKRTSVRGSHFPARLISDERSLGIL